MADRRTLGLIGMMFGFVTLFVTVTAFVTVRHHMDTLRISEPARTSLLSVPSDAAGRLEFARR